MSVKSKGEGMAVAFRLSACSAEFKIFTRRLAISRSRLVLISLVLLIVGMDTVAIHAQCMVRRVNAREKFRMNESLRQCIRPLGGKVLLALMRYAAYLSLENVRPRRGHLSNQVSGKPF